MGRDFGICIFFERCDDERHVMKCREDKYEAVDDVIATLAYLLRLLIFHVTGIHCL